MQFVIKLVLFLLDPGERLFRVYDVTKAVCVVPVIWLYAPQFSREKVNCLKLKALFLNKLLSLESRG